MNSSDKNPHYTYLVPVDVEPVRDFSVEIFAFTATLLVTEIAIPENLNLAGNHEFITFLRDNWHPYMIYVTSFMNIGNFWIAHTNIFANIVRGNKVLTRLNLLLLLSVTFLTVPSRLMTLYGKVPMVAALYGITLTFTYFMMTVITWFAYSNNRLTNHELNLPLNRIILLREGTPLVLSIIATGVAFFHPRISFLIYFFLTLLFLLPMKLFMKGVSMITPDPND